jgi:DNA-binding PadR family transcriptional regulator
MSMPAGLTTTSHAILGLLAIKPWTTYELATQMQRALGHFWPRAESKLYEEPKKLVALGLARATSERVGNRPRTVYTITPKGRRALAAWVPTPSVGPLLEFEHLVRVFFAEHGSKDDLLATIRSAREWAEDRFADSVEIPRGYLEGKGPFPERLPWLILAGQFINEFTEAVLRWAEWAEGVVADWPEDLREAEPDWPTLEAMAEQAEAYAARRTARKRPRDPVVP